MNYLTFKEQLLEVTGRTDLINPITFASTGIDFYVDAAQRWLDLNCNVEQAIGKGYFVADSVAYLLFSGLRNIMHVSISKDGSKTKLGLKDLQSILLLPTSSVGRPEYFAPAYLRSANDSDKPTEFIDPTGDIKIYNGIAFSCTLDGEYVVEVLGRFFATPLVGDTDESFWLTKHSALLTKTVMYQLEIFFRNVEGQKSWLFDILKEAEKVEHDHIETTLTEKVWLLNE